MPRKQHKKNLLGKPTLNVLFISLDKNLLREQQGDALRRHLRYAKHFNKLNTIVFTTKKDGLRKSLRKNNLLVIPTNSISRWFYVLDALRLALSLQRNQRIDLVSAQDPFITAIAGILIKWYTQAFLNIQIHNDYSSTYWKQESLQHRLHSLLLPLTLHFANSVRAVSAAAARVVQQQSKVFIVPVAVDLSFFKPSENRKIVDIISVSRLVKQKNLPLLIEVVSALIKDYPKLKVKIVGEGPEKESLQNLIDKEMLTKNIQLLGMKSRAEVRDLLQNSRIFVLSSNYEGWALAAVEAAASGLPVVMTKAGGAGEIVGDGKTGFIVPVNNSKILIEKLKELLENTKLQRAMGEKGREWVTLSFPVKRLETRWIERLMRESKRKEKICFVLPKLDPFIATHYPYTLKLFDEVAKQRYALLFVERGRKPVKKYNFQKIVVQKTTLKPINLIEKFFRLLIIRINGCSTFYIHYSYWSLFLVKLISYIFQTKILYWHAEEFQKKDLEKMEPVEKFLLNMAIKKAPILVTAGDKLKKAYASTFSVSEEKIQVVPNWVESMKKRAVKAEIRKRLNLPQRKKLVLFVHRLSKRKGAEILPEMIKKALKQREDIHFIIIGSGPLEGSLRSIIESDKNVTFLGDVPQSEILDYFSAADVFIMPSIREGSPRVILEAMAAGLPVVATDVGEVNEILPAEQKQFITSPNNPADFLKAIMTLLSETSLAQVLENKNRDRAKEYDIKTASQQLLKIL